MPERPIILFGVPNQADRAKKGGGTPAIFAPSHTRQSSRLLPKFVALQRVVDESRLQLQGTPVGIEPEKTLVFEVAGDLSSFYIAIKNLGADAEWIFEFSKDMDVSDDFYVLKSDKETRDTDKLVFNGKLYCVLANSRAIEEMLSLWRSYSKNPDMKFARGKIGFRDVFNELVDIHYWGLKERIEETGILEMWKEELLDPTLQTVNCEIELFFRKSSVIRQEREDDLVTKIESTGGSVLARSVIEDINYHAILAALPRQTVQDIIDGNDVAIVSAEQIMFFQSVGQSISISDEDITDAESVISIPDVSEEPIIALFDGVPQENHPLLSGLLNIDDPYNYTSQYTIPARKHGTSMASLIAHGDLTDIKHQITHKIYVRPIMKSVDTLNGTDEEIPDNILIVDTIHEAVRRLFEESAGQVAPTVKVINLSIGLQSKVFDRIMSPLARLLDWLSQKYNVLFIVSAGNHTEDIDVGVSFLDYARLSFEERDGEIIKYINSSARNHRLLSPAESMNALTVGANFSDNADFADTSRQILPCSDSLSAPYGAVGKGLNNAIKPDIVFDGGRNVVIENYAPNTILKWRSSATQDPGIISAAPFNIGGEAQKIMRTYGTSNATALISHEASRCYDTLLEVFSEADEPFPDEFIALLIKSMLVHGAEWGELSRMYREALALATRQAGADTLHKFFGYGKPSVDKAIECTKNRITLIGYGELKDGEAQLFDLPLPFAEFGRDKILRRLTATMAYFSPIVPSRQSYRAAQLWFALEGTKNHLLDKRVDADWQAVKRGSLQHEIFEDDHIVAWDDDDFIQIKVNCAKMADDHFSDAVPYALMVSFEVDNAVDIDVYERIAVKVKPRVLV